MVPNQIERQLKKSNNNPLLSHTKIPPNHNIFLYIYIYIYIYIESSNMCINTLERLDPQITT